MDTATEAPPAPRRALLRLSGVLVAVVSCLTLVLGSAEPAAATGVLTPPVVGAGMRAAPIAGPAAVSCVAVPICAGLVVAGGIGVTLYMTKDTWLPIVKGWANHDDMTVRADGSSGCPITVNSVVGTADGFLTVNYTYGATCGCGTNCGAPQMNTLLKSRRCVSTGQNSERPTPGEVYGPLGGSATKSLQTGPNGGTANTHTVTFTLGESGCNGSNTGYPYDAVLQITAERGTSANVDILWAIPDGLWKNSTDVTCRRPDGSTFALAARSEVGHPERLPMPSCYDVDPSSIPWTADVSGPGGDPMVSWVSPDWMTEYPDCFGPSGLLCSIDVWVGPTKCVPGASDLCEYWWSRKDNHPEIDCRFGTYSVGMAQCEPLKRAYRTGVGTIEITDPNDFPEPDPAPEEPEVPNPTHNPEPCNTDCPVPEIPPTDPTAGEASCLGEAWSLNPVDWVYVPVKCAFVWAFVPETPLSVRVGNIKGLLTGKAPFSWFSGFGSVPSAIPGGQCPDWTITVGSMEKNVVCNSSYTNAIRSARPVLTVFMAALALWPLIRSTAYAAFPIIKPQPGMLR